jgi:hypothetical protein
MPFSLHISWGRDFGAPHLTAKTTNYHQSLFSETAAPKQRTEHNIYHGPDERMWEKINISLLSATTYSDATATDGSTYYSPPQY